MNIFLGKHCTIFYFYITLKHDICKNQITYRHLDLYVICSSKTLNQIYIHLRDVNACKSQHHHWTNQRMHGIWFEYILEGLKLC